MIILKSLFFGSVVQQLPMLAEVLFATFFLYVFPLTDLLLI